MKIVCKKDWERKADKAAQINQIQSIALLFLFF